MNLAASKWEFRYRFWIFGAWYWLSFAAYRLDHVLFAKSITSVLCGLIQRPFTAMALRLVFLVGVLFCALASWLRTWATAYIQPEVMVDGALHTDRMVAEGPYRFVRNPLYLGTILLTLGYATMTSRVGAAILVVGTLAFSYRIILREERELSAAQGEPYERYCRTVPRLWPSLRPHLSASDRKPDWGAGLLGEMFFWGLTLALLVFAVTFDLRLYFLVLGLSFGVYFLCLGVIGAKRRHAA